MTRSKLDAAKMERARTIFAICPNAVRDLEAFLVQNGLVCSHRKEPRFLYDSMTVQYSNSVIAVQMDSQNGWHIKFADINRDPGRWYRFDSIRTLLQRPQDAQLTYREGFVFIKENWAKIAGLFSPENAEETRKELYNIEQAIGS